MLRDPLKRIVFSRHPDFFPWQPAARSVKTAARDIILGLGRI
jgi:hypothetical protein